MPRGTHLTDSEKTQIIAYKDCGKSNRSIAVLLGRSRDVINKFVSSPGTYGTKERCGRPRKLNTRDDRALQRAASNKVTTLMKINSDLGLNVGKSTIWRSLKRTANVVRRKMRICPMLSARHKVLRFAFAQQHITNNTDFSKVSSLLSFSHSCLQVIFTDEKKFNLDGPDGDRGYYHDLRKEPMRFPKRGFGGGSCMVWAAFCADSTVALAFVTSKMNSAHYQDVLRLHLLPFLAQHPQQQYEMVQDNAPIHVSRSTKQWLSANNVTTIDWPPLSPDLNPIENLWGILSQKVYANGKQYTDVHSLKAAITQEWSRLNSQTLQNLAVSMSSRLFQVAARRGGPTDY